LPQRQVKSATTGRAGGMRKAPKRGQNDIYSNNGCLIQILLHLLLIADVLPNLLLVQADRAPRSTREPRNSRPNSVPWSAAPRGGLRMALLPFKYPIVIAMLYLAEHSAACGCGRTLPCLHQFHVLLPAQLPENLPDLSPRLPKKLLLPILWQDHHVILAFPLHVGLTLQSLLRRFSFALSGPSQGGPSITNAAGTAEPDEFSPAELVD